MRRHDVAEVTRMWGNLKLNKTVSSVFGAETHRAARVQSLKESTVVSDPWGKQRHNSSHRQWLAYSSRYSCLFFQKGNKLPLYKHLVLQC